MSSALNNAQTERTNRPGPDDWLSIACQSTSAE
jgi:hypothetical protein